MSALVFRGVTFDIRTINNQTYITSAQLAQALKYSNPRSVTDIYNRNKDEFTPAMSEVCNIQTSGNLTTESRVFSLRGAHLIAMFSRTPVAKEFRKWVLDVLDRETQKPEPVLQRPNPLSILEGQRFEIYFGNEGHAYAQPIPYLGFFATHDRMPDMIRNPEKFRLDDVLEIAVAVNERLVAAATNLRDKQRKSEHLSRDHEKKGRK